MSIGGVESIAYWKASCQHGCSGYNNNYTYIHVCAVKDYNGQFTVNTNDDIIGGNLNWNKIHLSTYRIDFRDTGLHRGMRVKIIGGAHQH